jgi:hypothetical protein
LEKASSLVQLLLPSERDQLQTLSARLASNAPEPGRARCPQRAAEDGTRPAVRGGLRTARPTSR